MNQPASALESGLAPRNDEIATQGFGTSESRSVVETQAQAAAQAAQAAVQARYVVALQRPRDLDQVRVRLLKECRRPSFADVAIYHKPVGNGITGPSIRFAEAAIRCMTNILAETTTVYDDRSRRIVSVNVTDLEANVSYPMTITIEKTVERKDKRGRTVVGERINSWGDPVFIVEATDDEILNKERALVSKAMRTCALRILPGDIVDEAMHELEKTRRNHAAQDPDAARKKMVDAFASLGVQPSDLKSYLGHDLATASPAQIDTLRGIFSAIKEGETSWKAVVEKAAEAREKGGEAPPAPKQKAAPTEPAAPTDELDAEIIAIGEAIAAAQTPLDLAGLADRIAKLPESDRDEMKAVWAERQKEIEG